MRGWIVAVLLLTALCSAYGQPVKKPAAKSTPSYDFVLFDMECRMHVASLDAIDKKSTLVTQTDGTTSGMYCAKSGKRTVRCHDRKARQSTLEYSVQIDTAKLIRLGNETNSDITYIDPGAHSFVTVVRAFIEPRGDQTAPRILNKVCKGFYLTYDEAETLPPKP